MIESEWLNRPGPYGQYTHNPDPRLIEIIRRHGFAFDDEFWYWIPKFRNGKLNDKMMKRAPLWTYPCKSVPAEKSRRHMAQNHGKQKKIDELIT